MKYIFEISIDTDGDFCLPFVPCGMDYDDCFGRYEFEEIYTDRNTAIKDIVNICNFLKWQMDTSRDYVKKDWNRCIDNFIERLKMSADAEYISITEYMNGNYNETKFKFYTEKEYFSCGFYLSKEELDIIKNNDDVFVTNEMIKEAVLNLFRK